MGEIKKLIGLEVNILSLHYQVDIKFLDDEKRGLKNIRLRIEEAFQLEDDGQIFTIEQEKPETLAPIVRLLHSIIGEASLEEDNTLSLVFSNGIKIIIEPISGHEAWELQGDGIKNLLA